MFGADGLISPVETFYPIIVTLVTISPALYILFKKCLVLLSLFVSSGGVFLNVL